MPIEHDRLIDAAPVSVQEEQLEKALRPRRLADYVGQRKIRQQLDIFIEASRRRQEALDHVLLFGPPGLGKTTLAHIIAAEMGVNLKQTSGPVLERPGDLAALLTGLDRNDVLFIDEIHRFNKAQQDALLPYAESGLITLIGATTENPSFEVNSALLSRAQVYVLKSLDDEELKALVERARTRALPGLAFESAAIDTLVGYADGDARRMLNLLEQTATAARAAGVVQITPAFLEQALSLNARRFDKGGDSFYDQISALHKSVRGSHPDAALYWLCRMLDGGADPRYLARRIVRMAWEDIGLADPRAMQLANDAAATYERLGSPEGELALGQAVIYLAMAAKSNAGYMAYNQAAAFVKKDKSRPVPVHLRNAPTKLMKELGYGHAYRYAHDEPNAYAAGETYLPEGMREPGWYKPVQRGLELKIGEKLTQLRTWDAEARRRERSKAKGAMPPDDAMPNQERQ
ncbi:MAG: replication-associated recombination protein A [Lautropia mirabilis]|nr:replication-associated recombination protein A [Lautropia mirabilis]